ncbi:beta-barrel fold lipoprotein [uncultured Bacteroides sp.]|uniref:beta-barrel fold lipoprotein n=1 Tax=uncultured Bacteroides sp. TaxID=162156 RepID=UPI00261D3D5C|nr:beta-barrel fold lipoprotein [uncultured Bacteroides sp.]
MYFYHNWLVFVSSCSKNEPEGGSNAVKGKYKIEVTQTGDLEYFTIDTSITGGNGLNNGIYDENGNDLGTSYSLSEKESKRSFYSYETADDGITLIFVQLAYCEDLTKSMTTEVKVYFNGKLFDTIKRTFKGEDTSPLSKHWIQVED